eukprot:m.117549 g.117549  ORF g.117549 m.117549 type:complete len:971 (-) comp12877_c1_seq2:582-3494(-)
MSSFLPQHPIETIVSPRKWLPAPFQLGNTRVIVSCDARRRGKHILFDSLKHGGGRFHSPTMMSSDLKDINDSKLFLGLMYGTVPLAFASETTKIHELSDSGVLLFTRQWPDKRLDMQWRKNVSFASKSTPQQPHQHRSHSYAVSTPTLSTTTSTTMTASASNISSPRRGRLSQSPTRSIGSDATSCSSFIGNDFGNALSQSLSPHHSHSVSSLGSSYRSGFNQSISGRHRRLQRSIRANIEFGVNMPNKKASGERKRASYSAALIIETGENKSLKRFLFTHFGIINDILLRFQHTIIPLVCDALDIVAERQKQRDGEQRRGKKRHGIPHPMVELGEVLQSMKEMKSAVNALCQAIVALYLTPRIQEPVWLNLCTFRPLREETQMVFCKVFSSLIDSCMKQGCIDLLYSSLTAVLALHLGWVPTVTPTSDAAEDQLSKCTPVSLRKQAQSHPYDQLWMQLLDLCGGTAMPRRCVRTVVVGGNDALVLKFLYVITYFLRCPEVMEIVVAKKQFALNPEEDRARSTSSTALGSFQPQNVLLSQKEDKHETIIHSVSSATATSTITTTKEKATTTSLHPTLDLDNLSDTGSVNSVIVHNDNDDADDLDNDVEGGNMNIHNKSVLNKLLSEIAREEGKSHTPYDVTHDENGHLKTKVQLQPATLTEQASYVNNNAKEEEEEEQEEDGLDLNASIDIGNEEFTEVPIRSSNTVKVYPNQTVEGCDARRPQLVQSAVSHRKKQRETAGSLFTRSLGRSLLYGVSSKFIEDAILQGISSTAFKSTMVDELEHHVQHGFLGEDVTAASCLVINTDLKTCQVVTCRKVEEDEVEEENEEGPDNSFNSNFNDNNKDGGRRNKDENGGEMHCRTFARHVSPSSFVVKLVCSFFHMAIGKIPHQVCIDHIEDRLQTIYNYSQLLVTYCEDRRLKDGPNFVIDSVDLATLLNVEPEDLPLLLAVAGTQDANLYSHVQLSPTLEW